MKPMMRHASAARSAGARSLLWPAVVIGLLLIISSGVLAQAAAQTTVVFWSNHRLEDEPVFQAVIDAFEAAHPHIKIDWQNQVDGQVNYYNQLTVAIIGGVAPDVFYVRPGFDSAIVLSGWTYDIDPLVQRDADELQVGDFIPAQVAELQWKGKWWALPYDFSVLGLYYNQDLFDEAGIAYPTPGWSWDDVAEAARKLTRREGDVTVQWGMHGLQQIFSAWAEGFFLSFGGTLFDESYTRAAVTNPGAIATLELPVALIHEMQVAAPFNAAGYGNLFFTGQAGMTIDGSWATTTHRLRNEFRFDVSALPHGPAGLVATATGGGWAISATTAAPEAAWEFVKALASHDAARKLIVEPVRSLPPRMSLMREWAAEIEYAGAPVSAGRFADQAIEYGRAVPRVGFSFGSVLSSYRDRLVYGQISAREAAEHIERDLQTELDRVALK